ncbi:MAG: FcoT family thioesterase [Mycobacterium sp.]|nr:FcoT family thioesterase [Mycobacterium sp.]
MTTTGVTSPVSNSELVVTEQIPEDLLARVLEPYSYKGCRYLTDAEYHATGDSLFATGNFSIPESVYIRSTGHFNAVELVLCFNQLAYSAFAPAVFNDEIDGFRGWSIDDYFDNQLSSMLIRSTSSRYKRQIDARKFSARLTCEGIEVAERTWRYLKIPCAIEFFDDNGGSAFGEFELAVLNIP